MRKRINGDGIWKRLWACLAQGIALRNHAAEIYSCDRRARGNREKGEGLTGVIHDGGKVGLRWSRVQKNELVVHGDTSRKVSTGGNRNCRNGRCAGHINESDIVRR